MEVALVVVGAVVLAWFGVVRPELRDAAERTGDSVGDGTTTSTILAHAILSEGTRNIAAGASATLTVTFAPAATGSASGSVTIASNATGSPLSIPVSGTGVQHDVALNWGASTSSAISSITARLCEMKT